MQITTKTTKVTRSHDFKEGGFTIEASPAMFEILSSRIYTDVPLAIVRELSTNAADSHVEAGTEDTQFDVHLPDTFECFFSIRDYGTGLTREEIEHVYTAFGASTRRDSNDFTGCWGLGSKTPFAYADQFTVTSYRDGKAFTYAAFKENGFPAIAFMSEVDTDEPNGFEVHLNVEPQDIRRFSDAARKVYQHFPLRPNVKGVSIDYREAKIIMEGDGWKLYDTYGFLPARVSVLMGKVCYAANGEEIKNSLGSDVYLLLDVPTGDCSIAVSREELQYDDHTNTNLQRLVDKATNDIRKQVDDKLTNADSRLARTLERLKYSHILKLDDESSSFKLNVTNDEKESLYGMWGLEVRRKGTQLSIDRSVEYIRPRDAWVKKFTFIENDLPEDTKLLPSHKRKIRGWLSGREGSSFLVNITDRAAYLLEFGEPDIKLSNLPEVARATVTTSGGATATRSFIKKMSKSERRRQSSEWENIEDEIDVETSAYVPRKAYSITWNGRLDVANRARRVAELIGVESVYGLSESRCEKLAENTGLESLEEKARTWIEDYVKNASRETLALLQETTVYCRDDIAGQVGRYVIDALEAGMSAEVDAVLARNVEAAPTPIHKELINRFRIAIPKVNLVPSSDIVDRFFERYPLLKQVSYSRVDKAVISEYIELIEAKHASITTI
jgi:hypothetical protein